MPSRLNPRSCSQRRSKTREMLVQRKADMYALYERKQFGNMLLSWKSLDDYLRSAYDGLVNLRYAVPGSPWCRYGMTRAQVVEQADAWCAEGADRAKFKLNELARDENLVLQGEVMRSERGLSLRYSRLPKPMRLALKEQEEHADGVIATIILQTALDPSSWDCLNELLEKYVGAVVEFSTWSHDVGDIGNRNTVFWEVRHY